MADDEWISVSVRSGRGLDPWGRFTLLLRWFVALCPAIAILSTGRYFYIEFGPFFIFHRGFAGRMG